MSDFRAAGDWLCVRAQSTLSAIHPAQGSAGGSGDLRRGRSPASVTRWCRPAGLAAPRPQRSAARDGVQPGRVWDSSADPDGDGKPLFRWGADGSPRQPADPEQGGSRGAWGGGPWPSLGWDPRQHRRGLSQSGSCSQL